MRRAVVGIPSAQRDLEAPASFWTGGTLFLWGGAKGETDPVLRNRGWTWRPPAANS